jgi:asparagine synthase (glutamine-hydrolysing)
VLIDGQGADEMLGGYLYFYEVLLKEYAMQSWRKMLRANKSFYDKRGTYYPLKMRMVGEIYFPKLLHHLGKFKRHWLMPGYYSFLHKDFLHAYKHDNTPFPVFNKVDDLLQYRTINYGLHKLLRYADRNSMAHGVEVRFPFLDHDFVTFIFSLPLEMKIHDGWTKYLLRMMMDKQLPSSITWRINKLGYHVPTEKWLEHPRVKEMIRESKRKLVQEHIIRREDKLYERDIALFICSHFL